MYARMLLAAAGIAAVSQFPTLPPQALVTASLPLLLPALFCGPRLLRYVALILAGVCWGVLEGHRMLASMLPPELEGHDASLQVCLEGLPLERREHGSPVWMLRGRLLEPLRLSDGGLWSGRRVEFSWYGPGEFHAGEAWDMRIRLRAPRGFVNPGSPDHQARLLANGVNATGYVREAHGARRTGVCPAGLDPWRERLRDKLVAHAAGHPRIGGLLALTIGDASMFQPGDWDLFARSGTTHLVVISGMHISLVAGFAFAGARWLARRSPMLLARLPARAWGALAAAPALCAYAALAGWSVSVQRAVVMALTLLAALLLERGAPVRTALALAALTILAWQPLAALQPGFWLSFLSVAALVAGLGGRLRRPRWRDTLWRPQMVVAVALAVPLAAMGLPQAALAPLVNVFAIPLVDLLVVPSALLGCVLLGVSNTVAAPALDLALCGLEWLQSLLELAAAAGPAPLQPAGVPSVWAYVPAALGTLWLLAPRGLPGWVAGAILLLPVLLPRTATRPLLEVLFVDVGQGAATVVQTRGHTLVYDTGPRFSERFDAGRALLVPALSARGSRRVDLLMVSHADSDHAGGLEGLRRGIPVFAELHGEPPPDQAMARCERGMSWRWDGVEFRVLHPVSGDRRRDNPASCVLRIEAAGRVVLLTGDIDAGVERLLLQSGPAELRADLVQVPHHGSRSSSGAGFVAAVSPRWALVSSGFRNRFGHPHPDVVARWRSEGADILNTAVDGAILLQVDDTGQLHEPVRWRERERRFWHRDAGRLAQPD